MAFNLDNIKLNVFDFDVNSISTNSNWTVSIFCRNSVTARERDDESSEDGHVESSRDDDSSDAVDEKEYELETTIMASTYLRVVH